MNFESEILYAQKDLDKIIEELNKRDLFKDEVSLLNSLIEISNRIDRAFQSIM